MYNKLFVPLQHSVEVVYFCVIIYTLHELEGNFLFRENKLQ